MSSKMWNRGDGPPHKEAMTTIPEQLKGLTNSLKLACMGASGNASRLVSFMQGQQLHLVSRAAPFAAINMHFARSADSAGKGKMKKKRDDSSKSARDQEQHAQSSSQPSRKGQPEPAAALEAGQEEARQQRLKDQGEKRREDKRLANERKRQDAEAKRRAADERRQEAKRRQKETERKQSEEKRKAKAREEQQARKVAQREDKQVQKFLTDELRRIIRRKSHESEFVRSLDDIEYNDSDFEGDTTLTGLRPVTKEELTEEHNEIMRDILADAGASSEQGFEDKTLSQLLDEAEKERKREEMSTDEPGYITKSNEQIYGEMRGEDLRPHAQKMQLRPHEHEGLELDRFGKGHFFHPKRLLGLLSWGVVHDMSWGMFGKIPVVQRRLGPKWGGLDPNFVLRKQEFYDDILNIAPEMEMTVMMVAERNIPLAELRNKLLDAQHTRLRQIMYHEGFLKPISHKHRVMLAKIKLSAMEDNFERSGLIDSKGNIKQDSKLVLVVTEDGALTAEAVTPGTLVEQKVVRLGRWTDTTFARSVMDNFLGLYPADNAGKNAVGNGVLYCANGFDFRPPGVGNRYQFYDSPPTESVPESLSRPHSQEGFTLAAETFSFEKEHPLIVEDLRKGEKKVGVFAQAAA